jgi:hypothetical protein
MMNCGAVCGAKRQRPRFPPTKDRDAESIQNGADTAESLSEITLLLIIIYRNIPDYSGSFESLRKQLDVLAMQGYHVGEKLYGW